MKKLVKRKKGKILLNNVRHAKECEIGTYIFNIARGEMKGIPQIIELAPSWDLIKLAKENNIEDVWNIYKAKYFEELECNKDVPVMVNNMKQILNRGFNIELLCFCGDSAYCHRKLLAEFYFKEYEIITLH